MQSGRSSDFRVRIIWLVIRSAGLVPSTIVFAAMFVAVSAIVQVAEPTVNNFGDAAWLMFQVITTIGLGDFTCTTVIGRFAVIVLSLYSVFFLALVTSVVVSYCLESMRARRDESVAHFIDKLEHLSDLNKEELDELSEQVRRFKTAHTRP